MRVRKYCLIAGLFILSSAIQPMSAMADDETPVEKSVSEGVIYAAAEVPAEYPGGMSELMRYICNNIRYPQEALAQGKSGRVIVKFVVDAKGDISSPEIVKGICESLDNEALRLVRNMPGWFPGRINEKPVATYYTLPINFKLPETVAK